jgi:hypothetical protein
LNATAEAPYQYQADARSALLGGDAQVFAHIGGAVVHFNSENATMEFDSISTTEITALSPVQFNEI